MLRQRPAVCVATGCAPDAASNSVRSGLACACTAQPLTMTRPRTLSGSPGADVATGEHSPGADVARGKHSPGADVAGTSSVGVPRHVISVRRPATIARPSRCRGDNAWQKRQSRPAVDGLRVRTFWKKPTAYTSRPAAKASACTRLS
jgi:hypothetical protein